jgi:hypothetical protein
MLVLVVLTLPYTWNVSLSLLQLLTGYGITGEEKPSAACAVLML